MRKIIIFILSALFLVLLINGYKPLSVLAQQTQQNIQAIVGGLIIRNPADSDNPSSTLYLLKGNSGPADQNIIGKITAVADLNQPGREKGGTVGVLNISANGGNRQAPGLRFLPDGSLLAGGWANDFIEPSNEPQNTANIDWWNQTSNWKARTIWDFYFGTLGNDDKATPRLYTRSLILHEYNDPPDLVLQRSEPPENGKKYDGLRSVGKGTNLGNLYWRGYGGDWYGRTASIFARSYDTPRSNYVPGSLHIATASVKGGNAADRIVINQEGKVVISPVNQGDQGIDAERAPSAFNVGGDIYATGTITGKSKNFAIEYPGKPGSTLIHSSLEGPENAVYYRGEAQLVKGLAVIELPEYFEKLTRKEGRTVLISPTFESLDEPVSNLAKSIVKDGKFSVKATDSNNLSQKFSWEVKAVRADIPLLQVEK